MTLCQMQYSVMEIVLLLWFTSAAFGFCETGIPHRGWWRWAMVSLDGVARSRMVGVSASVNLPLRHKVQKFFSGTGSPRWFVSDIAIFVLKTDVKLQLTNSPRWSQKRAVKRLWCGVVWCGVVAYRIAVSCMGNFVNDCVKILQIHMS